jgi:hypothetical protein
MPRFPIKFKTTLADGRRVTATWTVANVFFPSIDAIVARCRRALKQATAGSLSDWTVGNDPLSVSVLYEHTVWEVERPDADGWYLVAPGEWRSARWIP